MARVPDEAIRRRSELTAGAWNLYTLYCYHRNAASGLCSPSNETLAKEMRCSYTHVSDSKTELVRKGWIRREGRQRVALLIGDFPPLKVRELEARTSENSELQLRKIPNLGRANFGKFRTSTSENSELGATPPITPYKDLTPRSEPVAAATATAENDFRKEPIDEEFCTAIVAAKLYPPHLVQFVRNKLVFRCAQEGVTPTKGRLLHWLSIEREEPFQRDLPGIEPNQVGEVVKFKLTPLGPNALAPQAGCDLCHGKGLKDRACECQICGYCYNTGTELKEGLAQPCRHLTREEPKQSAEAG